ncbi:alpha/beta hydrolase [Saccharopolyspora phatthalungensis]|uniref:Pimeloyl-ACP methyl ester carboxylesterase n=1 Tax=Saccharopolyspora phatthalungensis TaxID=664693 RepID=A0A840QBV5_9PSEU|nr:alpha/beta hydrolase [Saccharopolyspora phatthalungensis]MBB5156128.1 pimeloyl-ACP methyl ester carboxylesterase [Saccharopolyspora phatthalungensis]
MGALSGRFGPALAIAASALVTGTTVGAATPAVAQPPGAVSWGECDDGVLSGVPTAQRYLYRCATYPVPVDHDDPSKGAVELAMMRRAAADPDEKIGSLFLNPGGPGGPGFSLPVTAVNRFEPAVLNRFDIIGFDPRGVARSTPLRCFESAEQAEAVLGRISSVPVTGEQIDTTMGAYRDYGEACGKNAGELVRHMSTKDVARDLDLMRQGVGDAQLNFVGFSYGTLLGATYVNLFPERSRAIILDGNVDPALRTADGVQYDRERAHGFEVALDAFLRLCAEKSQRCAFGGGDPRAKFDEVRDQLRRGPITMPDGSAMTLDKFTDGVSGALYNPKQFRQLATDLQSLYRQLHPEHGLAPEALGLLGKPTSIGRFDLLSTAAPVSYVDDSYFGVNCTDKPIPKEPGRVPGIAAQWEAESPTFGRVQAFSDVAACSNWPPTDPDVHRWPWRHRAANPVLLFGNFYDPATQYEFSRRMEQELGNARLVSVDSFGHCILGGSACTDKIAAAYLTDLKVPKPGQVCQPDGQPFA